VRSSLFCTSDQASNVAVSKVTTGSPVTECGALQESCLALGGHGARVTREFALVLWTGVIVDGIVDSICFALIASHEARVGLSPVVHLVVVHINISLFIIGTFYSIPALMSTSFFNKKSNDINTLLLGASKPLITNENKVKIILKKVHLKKNIKPLISLHVSVHFFIDIIIRIW